MTEIVIHDIEGQMMVSSKNLALNLEVSHDWLMDFIINYVPKNGEAKFDHGSGGYYWLTEPYVLNIICYYINDVLGEDDITGPYWDLANKYIRYIYQARYEQEQI